MAKHVSRRQRTGMTAPCERPVPPTVQTVMKLRQDVVARLLKDGRLREDHVRAAHEVRRVWQAVGRALFPTAASFGEARQPHLKREFREPLQRMSDAEEVVWRRRYRPWADEMSLPIATGTIRVSRLQLVLDVVVDNHGLRQIEAWYRMRHGMGFQHLHAALERYCELAGWTAGGRADPHRNPNKGAGDGCK